MGRVDRAKIGSGYFHNSAVAASDQQGVVWLQAKGEQGLAFADWGDNLGFRGLLSPGNFGWLPSTQLPPSPP